MNKVIAKNGARHDAEKLFADLQEYVRLGIKNAMSGVVSRYGIVALTTESGQIVETNNSLLVSYIPPSGGLTPTDHGSISVAPGFAITEDLAFLEVTIPQSVTVPITDGIHTVYISPVSQNSEYAAVVNGFKYTPGTNTTPTRQIDSYEFLWDNPNPDSNVHSLILAKIDATNTGHEVEDHRSDNVMSINTHVLAQNFSGSSINSGTVARDYGGTGTNLSGGGDLTGGKYVLVQGADHVISSRALVAGDIPNIPGTKINSAVPAAYIPSLPGSIITSGSIGAQYLPYKEYVALITQDSGSDPTSVVISNTLGVTTTWHRNSTGNYTLTATSAFTASKTTVLVGSVEYGVATALCQTNNDTVNTIKFLTIRSGSPADDVLLNTSLLIRVYP